MLPTLAIPLLLGWLLSRRLLKVETWPGLFGATCGLAVVTTLVGVNLFYRSSSLQVAVGLTLGLQILTILAILWLTHQPWKAPKLVALPKAVDWSLVALCLLTIFYTNAQQIAEPDDDYWIHAPLQGLMRHGNFPPFNPFFSDIPMNGHYGRNLSIVTFSVLSGADVFLSQHLLTSGLQAVTFCLLFAAFLKSSGVPAISFLATWFMAFGINAGGRGGLIDTLQNNNPFVHLYLALLLYLFVDLWKRGDRVTCLLAGLTLGSYAIVYETHFGLVFLTVLGVTPILWGRGILCRRKALYAFAALGLSLPLAFTQGGPFTDLVQRKLHGIEHSQAENLSKGMQNQAQVVKLTVPKQELFQILLETGEYQRTSHIYTLDTPLKVLYQPSTERGYAYIWSWDVLKIHFLPLYLFPFSFLVLWRQASLAGFFVGAFGVIAFLTPALVNFGPIYESEYYRWQFAASLGFAGALGLALGSYAFTGISKWKDLGFRSGSSLYLTKAGARALLVLLLTLLNSYACLHFVSARLGQALGKSPSAWLLFPSTETWVRSHPVLDFEELDWKAAEWLSKQVQPGDRLLSNFPAENNFSILYESTFTGVSGARSVGHALPLDDEKIGTTPFRRSPAAVLFWETQRPEPLAQLQADWLLFRTDTGEEPGAFPGTSLARRFEQGRKKRLLYRIDQSRLVQPVTIEAAEDGESRKRAEGFRLGTRVVGGAQQQSAPRLRGGHLQTLLLTIDEPSSPRVEGTLRLATTREKDGLQSPESEVLSLVLDEDTPSGVPLELEIPFVPPYDEGTYVLQADWIGSGDDEVLTLEPFRFECAFASLLEEITLADLEIQTTAGRKLSPRTLLETRLRLELPDDLPRPREVLGCWAFYDLEREQFDLLPGVNLMRFELGEEIVGPALLTPERPGLYRLALYLSADQGQLTRIPAGQVEIVTETNSGAAQ